MKFKNFIFVQAWESGVLWKLARFRRFSNVPHLIFLHVVLILDWNISLESDTHKWLYGKLGWYVEYTGLWQNWAMFSPDPPQQITRVRMEGQTEEGTVTYAPSYLSSSWLFSRERKLYENLLNNHPEFLSYYLDYRCRANEDLKSISFQAQNQPIPPPGDKFGSTAAYEEIGSWTCENE